MISSTQTPRNKEKKKTSTLIIFTSLTPLSLCLNEDQKISEKKSNKYKKCQDANLTCQDVHDLHIAHNLIGDVELLEDTAELHLGNQEL